MVGNLFESREASLKNLTYCMLIYLSMQSCRTLFQSSPVTMRNSMKMPSMAVLKLACLLMASPYLLIKLIFKTV